MTLGRGPRGFPVGITGKSRIIAHTRFTTAGTHKYFKPQVDDPEDCTVVLRTWAGGGAGDNVPTTGGGGGGFNERAYPYTEIPACMSCVVGAGGTAPSGNGGDSYIDDDVIDVAATGGTGGSVADGVGGKPAFRHGTSTLFTFDHAPYNGGNGCTTTYTLEQSQGIWGAAGGGGVVTTSQPTSIYGGNGAAFDGVTTYPATAPGGGGSYYSDSGVGKPGEIEIIILRGSHAPIR